MDERKLIDKTHETVTYALLLIWWGLRWWPLRGLPEGSGMLGTALILLGVIAIRAMQRLTCSSFTWLLAIGSLVWGGAELVNSALWLPFKLPVFESLLILAGVLLLVRGLSYFTRRGDL